jgi:hypothetical protein
VEELVVVRAPGEPLGYEVELPPGFTLAHDGAAAVTISDPADRPVARGLFFSGWDARGARFAPAVSIEGARISVALDPDLSYPLLIDPEWVDAAVPVYPALVRRSHPALGRPRARHGWLRARGRAERDL